jgi:hypothetical protein
MVVLNQVTFMDKAAVERIFQRPHASNQIKESVNVKADPDEAHHIDDPDVVRELCKTKDPFCARGGGARITDRLWLSAQVFVLTRVDPEKAMASEGAFAEKFLELCESLLHMTKLAKRANYVLHVLMHLKDVKKRPSENFVMTETVAIATTRKQECARLLDASHGNAP